MESMRFQNNCLIETVLGPIKTFYLLLKATKAFLNFAVVYFSSSDTILSSRLFQLDAFLPRRQWHLLSIRILPAQRNHMVLWNTHTQLNRGWNTLLQQRNSHVPIAVRQWRPFDWDSFAGTIRQRPLEYLRQATRLLVPLCLAPIFPPTFLLM